MSRKAHYAVFLIRIPPGGGGVLSWTSDNVPIKDVDCGGLLFGDYDMHLAVPFPRERELPLVPDDVRGIAADCHELFLIDLNKAAKSDFPTRWRQYAKRYSLFCVVELGVQRSIMQGAGSACLRLLMARAQKIVSRTFRGSPPSGALDLFGCLGTSDLVCYLFSNDLESLDEIALTLRSLTVARVLEQADDRTDVRAVQKALKASGIDKSRHIFHSSYTMHGVMAPPDGSVVFDPFLISKKITHSPTRLRPLLFVGTFPGHESDARLRKALEEHGRPSVACGVFDLVVTPHVSELRGGVNEQSKVLRDLLLLLQRLWRDFGPASVRPAIVRTNTVFTRDDGNRGSDDPPHRQSGTSSFERLDLPPLSGPIKSAIDLLRRLTAAFNAVGTNRGTTRAVIDLRPALATVHEALVEEASRLPQDVSAMNDDDKLNINEVLRVTRRVVACFDGILAGRVAGVNHTIREEVASRQSGALHKLLVFYHELCARFLDDNKAVLEIVELPVIVVDIDGLQQARGTSYFPREDGCPRLMVVYLLDANLLHPARAFFALAHELMHALAPPLVDRVVPSAVVDEITLQLLSVARECFSESGYLCDEGQIRRKLRSDFEYFCSVGKGLATERRARGACAWHLLRCLLYQPGYLRALVLIGAPGSDSLPEGVLEVLDRCQTVLVERLASLEPLVQEVTADALAAFLTDSQTYLQILEESRGATGTRSELLRSCLDPTPDERPIVRALQELGARLSPQGPRDFYRSLNAWMTARDPASMLGLLLTPGLEFQ